MSDPSADQKASSLRPGSPEDHGSSGPPDEWDVPETVEGSEAVEAPKTVEGTATVEARVTAGGMEEALETPDRTEAAVGSEPGPGSRGEVSADAEDAPPAPAAPFGRFRTAVVSAVSMDLPSQHPTVVLRETESPWRHLSFSIALQDAVVLSHAMRRIPTPRPLTPELMSEILEGFDIDVVAVRLVGRQGSIHFAELDLRGRSGRSVHSCRPSDGITVALLQRVPAPILIDGRLLEVTGDVAPPSPARPA